MSTASLAKFLDDSQWDHVDKDVPVFMEHELWEVPHPYQAEKTIKIAVLPGEEKPTEGRMLYSIGPDELVKTAKKINAALRSSGNAIKVFIGHSDASKPQDQQPTIAAYGVGAKVGRFGPANIRAVLADRICYAKGMFEEAKKYPERSPEFKPMTGDLTGLALLKTDPKLPMGMMIYGIDETGFVPSKFKEDDVVFYAAEMLGGKKEREEEEDEDEPEVGDVNAVGIEEEDGLRKDGLPKDPTEPPSPNEPDAQQHEEFKTHMEHYKKNDPMMRYMCQKYESECGPRPEPVEEPVEKGAMGAAAGPTNGSIPGEKPGKKKPGEESPKPEEVEVMADQALTIQYQQLAASVSELKAENKTLHAKLDAFGKTSSATAQKYAMSEATRIVAGLAHEGYRFGRGGDAESREAMKKEIAKMAKLTDAGRLERANEIRENYAQVERDPTHNPFIEVYSEGPVEAFGDEKPEFKEEYIPATVKYCEENKLNPGDQSHWEKAMAAVIASKNGKAKK